MIVLIHGFTGSPASWDPIRPRLGLPDSRILALTALGHDGTPGGPDGPDGRGGRPRTPDAPDAPDAAALRVDSFEGEVDRLAAVVRDAIVAHAGASRPSSGSGRAHLVGYSMGGRLALGLLVRHPSLFRSATLIGASPGLADAAERAARAARDEEWARLLDEEGLDSFVATWEALPLFGAQTGLPRGAREHQDRVRRSHHPAGLARSLRTLGLARMPDYRPRLPDVDVAVRLVVGERDEKFRALATEMAALLPRAAVMVVPGAGHNVVLERPTEIADLLLEDMSA